MPVSGRGSGVPNQRLCVFVLFQLSTKWLNSTVNGSAVRLRTRQLYSPVFKPAFVEYHDILHGVCLFSIEKILLLAFIH